MDSNRNQIEEIKDRLDIAQVVEKYVKLKKTGKNYSGLCPFHNEKTPSFIVSPDIQRYKCFGCGESGDIFNFVQKVENLDFPETLERLGKEAGVEIKKQEINYKYKTLEEINYLATKYYYNQLKENKKALDYVLQRGMTKDSIKSFGVGYAPRRPELLKYLNRTKKYSKQELVNSGLFTLKNGVTKEKFYDRIMFPIRSKRGSVIAFTGRSLPGNDWGPKYMNSPETPIFQKKDNLFGQYESRQEIRKKDLVIICEGSTDVISAHQNGISNIVAPLGTALTTEQLTKISNLTKNILFIFDSDSAGKAALVRGFKIASELKLNPFAASTKPYKDIDDLLQKEPKLLGKIIKEKKEAFSFLLQDFIENKNLSKLNDINKIRDFISHLTESVKDDVTKNLYMDKATKLVKITLDETPAPKNARRAEIKSSISILVKAADNNLERAYLQYLLILEEISEEFIIPKEHILSENLSSLYQIIIENYKKPREELFSLLSKEETNRETFESLIFDLKDAPTDPKEVTDGLVKMGERLRLQQLQRKSKELSVKIAFAEENKEQKNLDKYMEELVKVNKLLNKKA